MSRPARQPLTLSLRHGTLAALMVAGVCSAHAQGVRGAGEMPSRGTAPLPATPVIGPADLNLLPPSLQQLPANAPITGGAPAQRPSAALPAGAPQRNHFVDGEITTVFTGTDRALLDASPARKEAIVQISPRLNFHSRGANVRLNGSIGFDAVQYVKDTNADYVQPIVRADLQSTVVDNLLFFDAGASVDRRAASPYAAQNGVVTTANQLKTGIVRLSPRLENRSRSGWTSLLRSDNVWTRQSGAAVGTIGQAGDSYSQNTQARIDRTPEPFGGGLEGGYEELKYKDSPNDVVRLANVRATLGYAWSKQFTTWLLGGVERSEYSNRSDSDPDAGIRIRWAPLERSVLNAEVRRRFFGTGYNVQWDHRHRYFGLTLGAIREPNTRPEAIQLAGNLGEQFDAIYRARGYNEAQREALVRAALGAYGLPANVADPVSFHVNRPQLSSTASAMVTFMGRRSVLSFSAFYRKLEELRRTDDPAIVNPPGDLRQIGGQVSYNFRLTPLSSLDALWRIDDTRGLGLDAFRTSREKVLSIGTNHALTPKTRLNLTLQHRSLEASDVAGPFSVSANSASLGLNYRF